MKQQIKTIDETSNSSKELLVVGSVILVLAIGGFTWYYFKKKKGQNASTNDPNGSDNDSMDASIFTTPPFRPNPSTNASSTSSSNSTSSSFYIKRGSRHPDVKILQRYLKY